MVWFQKSVKVGKVGRFLENKETDGTVNIFLMRLLKTLKYHLRILNISSQLYFPEEDVFQAFGLLNIIFEMTGSLKYKLGILNSSSQLKFPEDVF